MGKLSLLFNSGFILMIISLKLHHLKKYKVDKLIYYFINKDENVNINFSEENQLFNI
jgi:hypothetical protein